MSTEPERAKSLWKSWRGRMELRRSGARVTVTTSCGRWVASMQCRDGRTIQVGWYDSEPEAKLNAERTLAAEIL